MFRFSSSAIGRGCGVSILLLSLVSCTQAQSPPSTASENSAALKEADMPQVVATASVLCDLTEQIAGDTVQLTCLIDPGQDPHLYEPTPSDRKAIEDAALILYGGYGYESELLRILNAATAPKVAVFEAAVPEPILGAAHEHDDEGHDHAQDAHSGEPTHSESPHSEESHAGDSHSEDSHAADHDHEDSENDHAAHSSEQALKEDTPDPHVWHRAQNGAQLAEVIQENLAQISPENADRYRQTTRDISTQLMQIDEWIKAQVATVPERDRKLVTTHNSFQYYAQAYGLDVEGALSGLSTEAKPSAARMTELVDTVRASGVPAIFAETTTNPQLIATVAKAAAVQVAEPPLFVEGPGGKDTEVATYQQMLITNTCTIVNALGGECDRETAPAPAS